MLLQSIESLGQTALFLLFFSVLLIFGIFGFLLWVGWWVSTKKGSVSLYTKKPMQLGIDIAPSLVRFVNEFLLSHSQPENPPIDFANAAICQETGRVFSLCIKHGEIIQLDWSFLEKRYPGKWISWGSLTEYEQATITLLHESLAGFQTQISCPFTLPQEIDSFHALKKPGPLYVDKLTSTLLGWKEVPGTPFEVLIVQKPLYQSIDETL